MPFVAGRPPECAHSAIKKVPHKSVQQLIFCLVRDLIKLTTKFGHHSCHPVLFLHVCSGSCGSLESHAWPLLSVCPLSILSEIHARCMHAYPSSTLHCPVIFHCMVSMCSWWHLDHSHFWVIIKMLWILGKSSYVDICWTFSRLRLPPSHVVTQF